VKDYAAVSETVAAAEHLKKPWAKNLINACLRSYLRDKDMALETVDRDPVSRYSHPAWLLAALKKTWPDHWRAIVDADNKNPPMSLRVNLRKTSRELYLDELTRHGITAEPAKLTDCGLTLGQPLPVAMLPGFAEGLVSVQDIAAQWAAILLDVQPGARVLDACAAPGGKTGHLLERYGDIDELVAVDKDPNRTALIDANLQRLGLTATLVTGDATVPQQWWDGSRFDRILVDAPCSATGVIRRHPDIKVHRTAADISAQAQRQAVILDRSWPLLETGGKLLYATCSVMAEENERQIESFLARHPEAIAVPLAASAAAQPQFGIPRPVGRQILPGDGGMDGFYYALLQKT
jgi:16S rRNA (cytosine967-C5)-methyltransferase